LRPLAHDRTAVSALNKAFDHGLFSVWLNRDIAGKVAILTDV